MIGVDLDGTLAEYHKWEGDHIIGKPIPAMKKKVLDWIDKDETVAIFTARADSAHAIECIQVWLKENGFPRLFITNKKLKTFKSFYDDRAYRVEKNKGVIVNQSDKKDHGSHYRYEYKGIKLDPARILTIYEQSDVLLGAIVKKALCAGSRGHKDFKQDLNDIICAAERRLEMLEEDEE